MMTEIITGFYALFACITFAFLLWDECQDEFDHDAEDLGLITLSAVFWLPLVAAVLVAFLIDFWRKWVNRG
ncbi:hypothetical protein AM349_13465 [Citrobacter freundii]|jgi:hypothetical protein|uniref:Uncharacterized protein n=1 Tax=Citrobacter freundii TaxID=546 RepID=A0A8H9UK30_CITFR|nr:MULTISPECIES: hypothetical protein [Citrobacter freundii complex]MDU4245074.1 hypothetical protein [Varibaculum cambriense]ATX97026.1 hypothetical protein AM349_13465 [Citrobacter freundii]EKS57001.1 hypothetical protein D186_08858 [Citrobacter freundii ATCC 8090 = MTCC 1658 = NBRC 12681]EKV6481304.1 hypothetical protein [Citrobacter freundii]ELK7392489.1 hypothetical protein [Citrobacter freundii]